MKKFMLSLFVAFMLGALNQHAIAQSDYFMDEALWSFRFMWQKDNVWGLQEVTTDECFFPVRGTDWYDGGVWIDYYLQEMKPDRDRFFNIMWVLLYGTTMANNSIALHVEPYEGEDSLATQHRSWSIFARSFFEYLMLDIFGTILVCNNPNDSLVPEVNKTLTLLEFSPVLTNILDRREGFQYLTSRVKALLPDMVKRENAAYGIPNRDAALMLLAKLYLNEEVYTGESGYDSCLIYLNELINTGHYALANDYFDLFSVDNFKRYRTVDDEAILVVPLSDSANYNVDDIVQWVKTTFHYNQDLGGSFSNWNGCCVPQSYIEEVWYGGTDTATDVRWQDSRFYSEMAVMLGFNTGQQYDPDTGDSLYTRNGQPLNFTIDCPLQGATENQGFRVLKYPPRVHTTITNRTPNDYIVWRYADALLMKAECEARLGNDSIALETLNEIRAKRNAPLDTADTQEELLGKILVERGLELYWEGHRRQDLIRFGKFLGIKSNKESVSPASAELCPVPEMIVQFTCNDVTQNPGYSEGFMDKTKPTIQCPLGFTVESVSCTVDSAEVSLGTPFFWDNCGGNLYATNNEPAVYSKGKNTITWSVYDVVNLQSTCKQMITINCPSDIEEIRIEPWHLSPNPNPGRFMISNQLEGTFTDIRIYGITGQLIYSETWIQTQEPHEILLPNADPGIYIIEITASGQHKTEKLIVN